MEQQENTTAVIVRTEEDKICEGFVATFAPRLLLLIETSPTTRTLTATVEHATCGLRYAAQGRYAELRNATD